MTACFKLTHIADILSTQIYYFSIDGEFLHINQMLVKLMYSPNGGCITEAV